MRYSLIVALPFLLAALPAYGADTPQQRFVMLSRCMREHPAACASQFTAGSQDLYRRFTGYDVAQCIPTDLHYVSQQRKGSNVIVLVDAGSVSAGKRRARLVFTQEAGAWKLDIPASLRLGMGENWKQQVDLTEQIIIALRSEFGDQMNCQSVQQLVQR